MSETVFYAWQNDLPKNTNRYFIRNAIDDALRVLNKELNVEDALRADQDTQDLAGDINVAEAIFDKIDSCRIFVADISTVTGDNAQRPIPNPNVMIEYGRASIKPGSQAVVQIFNEAFGDWKVDRPFDLRHRRQPVLYSLPKDATSDQRRAARKSLAKTLEVVFRQILNAGHPNVPLPTASDFATHRELYENTPVDTKASSRIIGFWCAAIPFGATLQLSAPWDRPELAKRRACHRVTLGKTELGFETIDAIQINRRGPVQFDNDKGEISFDPISGGARHLKQYRYTPRNDGKVKEDVSAVHIMEDGSIGVSIRTNNLVPAPHLNVRWVMADVINTLSMIERVRNATSSHAPYALAVELRYDQLGYDGTKPVPYGEWRFCPIYDEQGHTGEMMSSTPRSVGPLQVLDRSGFSDVLKSVYTKLVTSAGIRPDSDLDFSQVSFD